MMELRSDPLRRQFMSDQEPIRIRSWLFTPATCPERFCKGIVVAFRTPWSRQRRLTAGRSR
jgi:hypothetical protein